jgi:hypothetical protein
MVKRNVVHLPKNIVQIPAVVAVAVEGFETPVTHPVKLSPHSGRRSRCPRVRVFESDLNPTSTFKMTILLFFRVRLSITALYAQEIGKMDRTEVSQTNRAQVHLRYANING